MTTLLHSVSQYGWVATIGDTITETFLSDVLSWQSERHSIETLLSDVLSWQSERLSITTKALYAYKPGTPGVEVLLDKQQLSLIVTHLSNIVSSSELGNKKYSAREILTITKAVIRISANCSGLVEEGIEEVLGALMEQGDEPTNAYVATITWQIAAALSGSVDVEEKELVEAGSSDKAMGRVLWDYTSPHPEDPDGTIALTDAVLQQLCELIFDKSPSDLSKQDVLTMETLVFTVFDFYWQSEPKMKNGIAELFGDKYIGCLIDLNDILHRSFLLKTDTVAMVGYGLLVQEMARVSTHFCDKAGIGGLVGNLLVTVHNYVNVLVNKVMQTFLDHRLTVLFYCAHIRKFHYSVFGFMSAHDTLTSVLQSPAPHTRLLARLVICCLLPIMESHHTHLLEMTTEEAKLLLHYIRCPKLPGGLDPAKFLMATAVLYREFCLQNASSFLVREIAQSVIDLILQDCDNSVLEGALCLLWTLCHTPATALHVSQIHTIVQALTSIQQSPCSAVSFPARSTLWELGYGNYKDPDECYLYAYACLRYGFYAECIDWCNHISTDAKCLQHSVARVRGKAYAYIYKNQLWHIIQQRKLDVTVPWTKGDFVDQCANNAKAAVRELGFALDQGVLDEEGSYLLDMAMLDYVKIKKQLKDCLRCLLCRRRGVKLKESHTIPKFLLKEVSNVTNKGLKEFGLVDPGGADMFHTISGRFSAHTSNTSMTHTLLCGRCEQCLSQNGEDQFHKELMPLIYSDSDEVQMVTYDSNLYSFCLGILFRSFVNNAFIIYPNASEMYSLLVACRQHLLSLPAKSTEKKEIPNPPPVADVMPVTPPDTFLIINPYKTHVGNSNLIPLSASMVSSCGTWYLTTPLSTEPKTKLCHAVVVRMAVCNVVVPFSPAQSASLDKAFCISAQGGEYPVLPDISRWKTIPPGLFQVFVDNAVVFMKQYQQVLSGMKTTKGDSRKADAFIQSLELFNKLQLEQGPIDTDTLQYIPPEEAKLISLFLSESSLQVKLLPEGFDLRTFPPQLILKEGYMLLYHIHDEQQNATFFFAASPAGIATGKLIVIMTVTEEEENYERVEGVHVHVRADCNSCSVCVTGYLQEPATEKLQESLYSRLNTVTERVKKAVTVLVQRCGSPAAFLFHARMQIRLQDKVCLDHRCSSIGCWYCKDRCHICMKRANQGYTLFPSKGAMFKHCGVDCKAIVDKTPQFSSKLQPVLLSGHADKYFILLSIEGCFESVLSTHTVVQVTICISVQNASATYSKPHAVIQLRTQEQHVFFSVYLADDFSPTEPIDNFPPSFSFQMFKESDILSQVIQMSLQHTEVCSVSHLLARATEAEPSLAKHLRLTFSPHERLSCEDVLVSLEVKMSEEKLYSKWVFKQINTCSNEENPLQLQSDENLSRTSIPLFPSASCLSHLFWAYLQFTFLQWKQALIGECNLSKSLTKKVEHATHVTIMMYEQSPLDLQNCIIGKFCSSSDVLLLCGRLAIAAVKGGVPLSLHELAVKFLILVHKFIATPEGTTDIMRSVVTRHLCRWLEGIKQLDLRDTTKMSAVAQHFLLTLLLRSLCKISVEVLPTLLSFIQTLTKSHFIIIAVMAKAVAIQLQSCAQVTVSDIGLMDKEVDFIAVIIHELSQDSLKRRYYLNIILQILILLCSHPMNTTRFASHSIVAELQTLMETADEAEDMIAIVLWKIASGGETDTESSGETFDKPLPGEGISEAEVDLSLQVDQGLRCTIDKLLVIIAEFNNLYLECRQVPQSQAHTLSAVAQLLLELHQVMERREKEELAESVAKNPTILTMFGLAVSKYRQSWHLILNGILTRKAIELLLITWADCSIVICQALAGVGGLKDIADSFNWALKYETLTPCDAECLQNQVCIIFKCARMCPLQTAFQLENSDFQALLHCSSVLVRILSKSILAFLANYREVRDVTHLSLQKDEVVFVAKCLTGLMQSGSRTSTDGLVFSSVEEILQSLQHLTSLPSDKSCCVLPLLLDALLSLCSCDDKPTARLTLEVLWNLSTDPTVALAILSHENAIRTLQIICVFTAGLSDLSSNILWTLGYGNALGVTSVCKHALACYQSGKYKEAATWCDHLLSIVDTANPIISTVKSCKGKALAQMYLCRQSQRLLKNSSWALLGYDNNSTALKAITEKRLSNPPAAGSKVLRQLSLADLENWEDLCSQGLQAIQLLGEVLDSDELDEEGSELLDWVMMDYSKETGGVSKCKRCLLCRVVGDLIPAALKPLHSNLAPMEDTFSQSIGDQNIFSLQSFMYINGSQKLFMFCRECEFVLSHHRDSYLQFLSEATKKQNLKPVKYDRGVYLHLVAHVARSLPLAYTGCISNQKDVYTAFLACRQTLLSPDKCSGKANLSKMYLINNPFLWYVFKNTSFELYQSSRNLNDVIAIIASQQEILNGGDPHKCRFFLMHTGAWNLVLDFGSGEESIPPEYLVHPGGGSYPLPSPGQRWEAFPPSVLQAFHNLALADEHRGAFQSVLRLEGQTLPKESELPLLSSSAMFLLPCKRLLSFLPEQFLVKMDSDNIRSISLPIGHTILGHHYDCKNDVTFLLACASDSKLQERQFYSIITCRLWGYCLVEALVLNGSITTLTSPVLFPMTSSLAIQEVDMVRQLLRKKFDVVSYISCLAKVLIKYGSLDFTAVSTFKDITRNINLAVAVDARCSPKGCWYCKHRCHSCLRPAAIGYAHRASNGSLLHHCSERCYHMHTANIAASTVLDVNVGEVPSHPMYGSYLLLSATVLLHTRISKNTVMSIQLSVTYNCKSIPSGVAYVFIQYCTTEEHSPPPITLFIQHDLSPVKGVWCVLEQNIIEIWRENALIKRALQPVLDSFGCADLPSFLQMKFPYLNVKFMGTRGRIYSMTPTGVDIVQEQEDDSTPDPHECIRSLQ